MAGQINQAPDGQIQLMNAAPLKQPVSNRKQLLLAALSLGLALAARADDFNPDSPFPTPLVQKQQFAISPFYGYRFGGAVEDDTSGTSYSFEDSSAFGLFLDYAPENYAGRYELLWSHQDSSLDFQGNNGLGNVDLTIDVFQVGGVAEFGSERFREYVSVHVGVTHFAPDDFASETRFSFGIGAGVKAFVTKNLYLRADVRGFCTVTEASGSFIYVNGITVATFTGSTLWQGQVSVGCGITF
jgi:opacity protein-like surface antigen